MFFVPLRQFHNTMATKRNFEEMSSTSAESENHTTFLQKLLMPKNNDKKLLELVQAEWSRLHAQGTITSPLFESTVVEQVILKCIHYWLRLEAFFCQPTHSDTTATSSSALSGTESVLLTGVHGGKNYFVEGALYNYQAAPPERDTLLCGL